MRLCINSGQLERDPMNSVDKHLFKLSSIYFLEVEFIAEKYVNCTCEMELDSNRSTQRREFVEIKIWGFDDGSWNSEQWIYSIDDDSVSVPLENPKVGTHSFNLVGNELDTLRCYMPYLLIRGNEKLQEATAFEKAESIRIRSSNIYTERRRFLDYEIVQLGISFTGYAGDERRTMIQINSDFIKGTTYTFGYNQNVFSTNPTPVKFGNQKVVLTQGEMFTLSDMMIYIVRDFKMKQGQRHLFRNVCDEEREQMTSVMYLQLFNHLICDVAFKDLQTWHSYKKRSQSTLISTSNIKKDEDEDDIDDGFL